MCDRKERGSSHSVCKGQRTTLGLVLILYVYLGSRNPIRVSRRA